MCNLNIIVKTTNKQHKKFTRVLKNVTSSSYQTNRDGDGVYFSGTETLVRSQKKVRINMYSSDIEVSNFIITHQRIATSGFSGMYTQPFDNSDFVLAHNGVMDDFIETNEGHSDTYGFFAKFMDYFNKRRGDRQKKIIRTIKHLLDEQGGSFSICLYDKIEKKMYYFKNFSTNVNFYKSKKSDVLFITTSWTNNKYLDRLKREFDEMEIKDQKIYEINIVQKKIHIIELAEITEKKPVIMSSSNNYPIKENLFPTVNEISEEQYWGDGLESIDEFKQIDVFSGCLYCEETTDWCDSEGYPVCRNCQDKHIRSQRDLYSKFNRRPHLPKEELQNSVEQMDKTLAKLYDKIEVFKLVYDMNALTKNQIRKLRKMVDKKYRTIKRLEDYADEHC